MSTFVYDYTWFFVKHKAYIQFLFLSAYPHMALQYENSEKEELKLIDNGHAFNKKKTSKL